MIEYFVCVNCFHKLFQSPRGYFICINSNCKLKNTFQYDYTVTKVYTEEEAKWEDLERLLKKNSSE